MPRPAIPSPIGLCSSAVWGHCRIGFRAGISKALHPNSTRPPWKALADMDTKTDCHTTPTDAVEDDYLLRGTGRYMADAPLPGQTYACFVRSQHACADIKSIDIKPALAIKGVIAVLTAADIKAANVGNLSQHPPVAGRGGAKLIMPVQAGARGRPGAPHRRGGRHGDRRDLRGGAGRRRGGRGGLRAARSDHRSARGGEARRAAGVARGAGQHRGRLGRARRQSRRDGGEGRRGDEVGRACGAHLARASAHQRRLDGAARRHRELRRGERTATCSASARRARAPCATRWRA